MESHGLYVTTISVSFLGDPILADEPPPPAAMASVDYEYRTKEGTALRWSSPDLLSTQAVFGMTVRELIQHIRNSPR